MRKTKIEATKTIFIVKALTIIISSIAPIVEGMKGLSMTVAVDAKTIKKRSYQK